ncbi:MAG: DUF4145 domain-containing protein [bacterium]|nr:DUF4145 domain-containing protein [bacterium]
MRGERFVGRPREELWTFQAGPFALRDDLLKLDRVYSFDVPEAVILYCTRGLEALATEAVHQLELEPSGNAFSNLELLRQTEVLSPIAAAWAHTLRRLGNDARHIRRICTSEDARLACLMLERWIHWFFCEFPGGLQLRCITTDECPLLLVDDHLHDLFSSFNNRDFDPTSLVVSLERTEDLAKVRCPALYSLLAEMLLDRRAHDLAESLLVGATSRFPADVRLLQLLALLHSHRGELEHALKVLEPLHANSGDDPETVSVMAGVRKRQWWSDPSNLQSLSKSHRLYRRAWDRSRHTNVYLGTNAATTALWLGRHSDSREIATDVCRRIDEQDATLARILPGWDPLSRYWRSISHSEAQVLLGDHAKARDHYLATFDRHRERKQNIEGTKRQLGLILTNLIGSSDVTGFLSGGWSTPSSARHCDGSGTAEPAAAPDGKGRRG